LATNGIKYNKEGGTLEISISDEVEGTVRINFTDTGIGIPANKMHRLFIPFDRLDIEQSTLNIEGTGLGLALCEKLATEMGGTIEAQSEEGQGSTFTVTLKACPAPELAT
jgi:signal transduction histidine kinase